MSWTTDSLRIHTYLKDSVDYTQTENAHLFNGFSGLQKYPVDAHLFNRLSGLQKYPADAHVYFLLETDYLMECDISCFVFHFCDLAFIPVSLFDLLIHGS